MPTQLQEELKQSKPFPRLQAEALISVLRTAAVLDHALSDGLKPHGITLTQYNVLRILRGAGERGLCGREVGERLVAQVPDVSRLLDRMGEIGLVSRERDDSDRRHVTARITAEGRRLLSAVDVVLERIEQQRFGKLEDGELRSLIESLGVIRESR